MELPDVQPFPEPLPWITDDEAREVLVGLRPGEYVTRDLYPRYLYLMEKTGRKPGTRNSLGMALLRICGRSRRGSGHVAVWQVTEEHTSPNMDTPAQTSSEHVR